MSSSGTESAQERSIDWKAATVFLRRRVDREAWRATEEVREELTQLALMRLLRAARRSPIDNLEAFMNVIAHRVVLDWLDSDRIQPAMTGIENDEGEPLPLPTPTESPRARLEQLRWIVLEFFRLNCPPCRDLAELYFEEVDWKQVAATLQRSYDSVRAEWSRKCLALLKEEERKNPGTLSEFLDTGDDVR